MGIGVGLPFRAGAPRAPQAEEPVDPIIAAGALAYWRWDAGVTDSSGITSWVDRVSGYDLTATGTEKPTLGVDSIEFDGVANQLYGAATGLPPLIDQDQGFTWFVRFRSNTASGANRTIFCLGTATKSWNKSTFHLRPNGGGAGRQRMLMYGSGGAIFRDRDATDAVSDGVLTTIDGRIRGPADSDISWAIDGTADSTGADAWSGGTAPACTTFSVGAMRTGIYSGGYFADMDLMALVIGPPGIDQSIVRAELASEFP